MKTTSNPLGGAALAAAILFTALPHLRAEDKYLRSLEDRIAALEAEVNTSQTDAKGKKGAIESIKIPVYVTPKSKYVEQLKLRGLLQYQFGYTWGSGRVAGSHGSYSTQEIRRARIGVEGKVANDFSFLLEAEIVPGAGFLRQAYIRWDALDFFQPQVGYFKPIFGYEENTSAGKLLTPERSRIVDQFRTGQITGAAVNGEYGFFNYSLGIFNSQIGAGAGVAGTQPNRPLNQNYAYNASAGLNFSEQLGFPLELRADYLNLNATANAQGYSTNTSKNTIGFVSNSLRHNFDLSLRTGYGPFDLRVEWYYGFDGINQIPRSAGPAVVKDGADSEYIWAVVVEPSIYLIPDKLQLVARYQYGSSGFEAFVPAGRYERRAIGAAGINARGPGATRYWAIYSGLQYFINGDDLKIQAGYEYSEQDDGLNSGLGDYSANTLFAAVRLQF